MSEENSPFYADGHADGESDAAVGPLNRRGLDPTKAWSIMYRKGYLAGFPACEIDPYDVQNRPETAWKRAGMSRKMRKKKAAKGQKAALK